jgi:hypothetical protein
MILLIPRAMFDLVLSGVVPVTLVNSKKRESSPALIERQSTTHAEYSGSVLFRNQFVGELPAAEYPKIGVRLLSFFQIPA